ncbi:Uncharacterized protein NEOC65_002432 [Neochlamydia sp. AcF65]|nr:Uncharacterized protein [Neochlamydia sp. AcF65]MBS4169523.1 Uncharacterized protein [Neochlamydia sp. AcF95]
MLTLNKVIERKNMQIKLLINPRNQAIAAELIPDVEVKIHEKWMLDAITASGITVSKEFKEQYHTGWYIYPNEDKAIFAKVFEQFYFIHGLQQQGYYWREKDEYDQLSPKEKLAKIISLG